MSQLRCQVRMKVCRMKLRRLTLVSSCVMSTGATETLLTLRWMQKEH